MPVPELRIYRVWDKPVGPHPVAMFEVNLFTPAQFGAFIPWLVINRGPLSALVHPNTDDEERDHAVSLFHIVKVGVTWSILIFAVATGDVDGREVAVGFEYV